MPESKPFSFSRNKKKGPSSVPSEANKESLADMQSEILNSIEPGSVGSEEVSSEKQQQVTEQDNAEPIGPIETALRQLKEIEAAIIEEYGGKKKYNPYIWITKVLVPLKKRIQAGDSQAINEMMTIEVDEIDCTLEGMNIPYGEDKGVFANKPRAAQG